MTNLAWVQWWATPWMGSHESWISADKQPALNALCQTRRVLTVSIYGVVPCLPPPPEPTLLQLALAPGDQLDLILALINNICRPSYASVLDEHQQQWCKRLSKALTPDMLQPAGDPLQLLRAWVNPDIWQRLRLRFPRQRVLAVEQTEPLAGDPGTRLDTLWQAVVWRAAAKNGKGNDPLAKGLEANDVLPN